MKKFTKQQRILLSLTVCLLIAGLAFAYQNQQTPATAPVSLMAAPVSTINKPLQIVRTGTVENSTSIPVRAEISGLISETYVSGGQTVKAGQPLMKIQAFAAPAAVQSAEAPVPAREPQRAQPGHSAAAAKNLEHYQKLYDLGAISRRELDMAAARLEAAENEDNAPADDTPVTAAPAAANAPAPAAASATIKAPTDGAVTSPASPGAAVQVGQHICFLGSGQPVELVVNLEQNDLYLVHLGTPVTIEVADQMLSGQVSSIYPQIDANQIPSFLAHIKLVDNPSDALQPGVPANINIDIGQTVTVPAVPTTAIFQDDEGRNFVYLAVNGKALKKQVTIGETSDDLTEITSKLPQDSLVITSNIEEIKNGAPITIVQQ